MMRSKQIGWALVAVVLLAVTATVGHEPPKNLKQVGPNHWSAWDPPAAEPGDYVIQPGDTLWDLSGTWLGDPYLWPLIWEQNQYILDSHWIYPGDPLKVPGEPTVVPDDGPPVPDDDGGGDEVADVEPEPIPLIPIADPVDFYCSGYIDPYHQPADTRILGHELERRILGEGDVIYLTRGRDAGIEPGSVWGVVRPSGTVAHPVTGDGMGDYVRRLGRVRVMAVQEKTSLAVIEMSCEDIWFDDGLVAWEEFEIPTTEGFPEFDRYDLEPSGKAVGYVVAGKDDITNMGQGHIIYTDLGAGAGLASGELVTLFRERNPRKPRVMLGQAVVLTAEDETATLRIVDSVREIFLGDRVEIR